MPPYLPGVWYVPVLATLAAVATEAAAALTSRTVGYSAEDGGACGR